MSVRNCLWMKEGGAEAARFYVSLFDDAEFEADHGVIVLFRIGAQRYQILNGGDHYLLTPAFSISITTEDQAETDRLWDALAEGGKEMPNAWVEDRFGLSWQIVPKALISCLSSADREAAGRAQEAMLKMTKIDIAAIEAAHKGG